MSRRWVGRARWTGQADAVATVTEQQRIDRGKALTLWAKGFVPELEEHHCVEDTFFFPRLRTTVASAGAVIESLVADHSELDVLLARCPRSRSWSPTRRSPSSTPRPTPPPSPRS